MSKRRNYHKILCETEGSFASYNSNKQGAIETVFIPRRKKREIPTDDNIRYFSDSSVNESEYSSARTSLHYTEERKP